MDSISDFVSSSRSSSTVSPSGFDLELVHGLSLTFKPILRVLKLQLLLNLGPRLQHGRLGLQLQVD